MSQPIVASCYSTFLKREMRHIYRRVTGLRDFQTFVMTKSRENTNLFPFVDVEVLPHPELIFLCALSQEVHPAVGAGFLFMESTTNSATS